MVEHPSRDRFVSYLTGVATSEASVALEGHVAACPACAAVLQEEASFEAALFDAADPEIEKAAPARKRDGSSRLAMGNLAMAAAVLFALFDPGNRFAMQDTDVLPAVSESRDAANEDNLACFPSASDDENCEEPPTLLAARHDELITIDPLVTEPEPACASQADGGVVCDDYAG